jgi:hypothetical protein
VDGPLARWPPSGLLPPASTGLLRSPAGRPLWSGSQREQEGGPGGPRCWRTSVAGTARAGGQKAHARAGRGAGVGWRTAWGQRAPTPLAGRCAPLLNEWSFTGRAVCYEHEAGGRLPMAGACLGGLGDGAQLGGRSPGLRLAAAVLRPWKATQCNLRSLLRQGHAPSATLQSCPTGSLDTRSLRLAAQRKDEEHKLQRPAAQRPGERRACFTPPPLETQRPWGAKQPLRAGCSTQPKEKPLENRSRLFGL